jgi:hypothetical protein
MTQQPIWKLVAQLGDVNPVDYGGCFVYTDETGVYAPEMEILESPDDDDAPEGWTVYRVMLEPCTYQDGVLSDNKYHPTYPVWFADKIADVARSCGIDELNLLAQFTSPDAIERAWAYRAVGEYFGFYEFDQYPLTFHDRADVDRRYAEDKAS